MKKQFVTYEIALKLKELGFDEGCLMYWSKYYSPYFGGTKSNETPILVDFEEKLYEQRKELPRKYYSAPLWQQVIDWLREEHNILITEDYDMFPSHRRWVCKCKCYKFLYDNDYGFYEAREQAILKAIELIKK